MSKVVTRLNVEKVVDDNERVLKKIVRLGFCCS